MMIHIQKTACFQRPAPLVQTSFSQDKSHAETHLCSAWTHAQETHKQTQDNREEIRGARWEIDPSIQPEGGHLSPFGCSADIIFLCRLQGRHHLNEC